MDFVKTCGIKVSLWFCFCIFSFSFLLVFKTIYFSLLVIPYIILLKCNMAQIDYLVITLEKT